MQTDMTKGPIMKSMLAFAAPMMLGNLMQQFYNIADTLIVGKVLGPDALAAVGSSFTLMTFLTSILLGLCMGSGAFFSIRFGERDEKGLKDGICASFLLILVLTILLNIATYILLDKVEILMNIPPKVWTYMRDYLSVIFCGIFAVFLYNYFASLLRSVGNSLVPLVFLAVSAVLNIGLDIWFVVGLERGVAGAAEATVIAQYISGIAIAIYSLKCVPYLKFKKGEIHISRRCIR
ncbi:MAG: polysaccharide biosynthesis C-terminal domain-containing protein, partial [Lachnospiraceae bacterium]|nr:polysaccharide biosynthesis C-terminal domain-containing protein [Lachnospiraceae bacterium]